MWLICMMLLLFMGCSDLTERKPSGLLLNEIMVKNAKDSGIIAPNGKSADWIELYNMGDEPVQLADYFLSDDTSNLYKANLPTVLLAPGEFITLWCGGKGNEGELFLGFHLSSDSSSGECVLLSHRTEGIVDSCLYLRDKEALKKGRSYGRLPDGGIEWVKQKYPSPTASNNG